METLQLPVFSAPDAFGEPRKVVITGLEHLLHDKNESLHKASVAILANHTAVTSEFVSIYDAVLSMGATIRAAFGPEHGAWGDAAEGANVSDSRHDHLKVPVYSLYGNRTIPTDDMLAGVDLMLVDLQDIGARFYTYIHTMNDLMVACGRKGIPVWILDRPNPISGTYAEGPLLDNDYKSGVGKYPIPIRHGLTLGELAKLFVTRFGVECELAVIPMLNWTREMWFDETGLPWIAPSPNMPTLDTATVYPGACLIEGTNSSEGRGTARPFEYLGAPWVNPIELRQNLERWELPGVKFREISFIPWASKHNGTGCRGVQIHVTDRIAFRPVLTGVAIVSSLCRLYEGQFQFTSPDSSGRYFFDLLAGTPQVRKAIEEGVSPWDIAASWQTGLDTYHDDIESVLLY